VVALLVLSFRTSAAGGWLFGVPFESHRIMRLVPSRWLVRFRHGLCYV
jgi:hypothetical protein